MVSRESARLTLRWQYDDDPSCLVRLLNRRRESLKEITINTSDLFAPFLEALKQSKELFVNLRSFKVDRQGPNIFP